MNRAKLFPIALSYLLLALVATFACHCLNDEAEMSRKIIWDEVQKLDSEMQEIQNEFDTLKKKFFYDKRELAEQWKRENRQLEAKELINFAQVMTLIEAIKYAVQLKTLEQTQQMIGGQFVPLENGFISTGSGVTIRAEMVSILVARSIARAAIEADRQSQLDWNWLHKLIEHNLSAHKKEALFKKMARDAYRQLLRLRSRERTQYERYYAVMKSSLNSMNIDLAQSKTIIDGLDFLIEQAMNCANCHSELPSIEYFNTRPLFANNNAVLETLAHTIDQDFMDSFVSFDDDQSVYHVSSEEQKQVKKYEINALMEQVIGGSGGSGDRGQKKGKKN